MRWLFSANACQEQSEMRSDRPELPSLRQPEIAGGIGMPQPLSRLEGNLVRRADTKSKLAFSLSLGLVEEL
jgi:hypothetical protein